MWRQCAWCGAGMGRSEPLEDERVTHGICPDCVAGILRQVEGGARAGGGPHRRLASRVLVVEDNRDAADSLAMALGALGYEVRVAYAGDEGLSAARAWQPDVVLCDIGLPGLDGYAVAEALRRHPPTARARLIAVTGYGRDEDRRRSAEVGFEHHFVKPLDFDALRGVLARN